jgi:8-oxo-dGTP pyrophosphatase MutT (NUDIX family)
LAVSDQWRTQLLRAVSPFNDGVRTLQVNNFRASDEEHIRPARTAAVLVPVLNLEQPEILLTRRAAHLSQHAGQVSFPGGAAEDSDDTAVFTALREAEEEVGLSPEMVEPLGFLDRFDTVSDYRVLPVVGLVKPPVEWKIDSSEVDDIFTLPLSVALDRKRYTERVVRSDDREYVIHSIEWQGNVVWGLTAAMLMNLLNRMERQNNRG